MITASLSPNLQLLLWRYCCCSGLSVTPPKLTYTPPSPPPLLPLYSIPVAELPGLCCSATAVLRFPRWSFEGNKTLPQDKQQRELERPWGRRETVRQSSGSFESLFLGFKLKINCITTSKLQSDLVTIRMWEDTDGKSMKFTLHMLRLHLLLLKLKSYLMMTEHPSWETAVFFKVAEPQGYANIW